MTSENKLRCNYYNKPLDGNSRFRIGPYSLCNLLTFSDNPRLVN